MVSLLWSHMKTHLGDTMLKPLRARLLRRWAFTFSPPCLWYIFPFAPAAGVRAGTRTEQLYLQHTCFNLGAGGKKIHYLQAVSCG